MDTTILRVILIGFTGIILATIIAQYKKEYSLLIVTATSILIVLAVVDKLMIYFGAINTILKEININMDYIQLIIKIVLISYICEFAVDICNDSGYKSVGNKIKLSAKIIILYLTLPILYSLIELIRSISI